MQECDGTRYSPDPEKGLNRDEVQSRYACGLVNTPPDLITKTIPQIIYSNVVTLFNAFNIAIGVCIALVGSYENLLFLFVILFNILLGITLEIQSKRKVEKLSILSMPRAYVIRDGEKKEIQIKDIVLDDIIVLQTGAQISADSIVASGEVEVNEALLTGEAEPVLKRKGDLLLSGSFVVSGLCHAQVERIGADNFATKIAQEARKYKKFHSELMDSLNRIVRFTSYFIVPVGAALFLSSKFIMQTTIADAVTSTSAALIGMLPRGLVLLTSISLTAGVIKLAQKKTLVQELFCIEALSRVDMLCLDKTGTITQGKMEVTQVIEFAQPPVAISRAGGLFVAHMEETNATAKALMEYFAAGETRRVVNRTPFSSDRKWSSVTLEDFGTVLCGAPEMLMEQHDFDIPAQAKEAAQRGSRVLLLAFSSEPAEGFLPKEILPVAVIVLSDPIRADARENLAFFAAQGVAVKLISGDHPVTASAIATQAGLLNSQDFVDMSVLETDEEIESASKQYTVFGRVSPVQKRTLIKALKKQGHTVAMVGDGVNDVLALKEADCSVAMAAGSDAARQVSKLILMDSNFASLPSVVMEGRRVVNNITRVATLFMVKTIFSFLLSIIAIFSLITPLKMGYPFVPVQLTLISSLFVGIPSFFLALEPNHAKVKSDFLARVLSTAIPGGIAVVLAIVAINILSPALGLRETDVVMLGVYVTSFISYFMLARACTPFTKLRAFLLIAMAAGFFAIVWKLSGVVHITLPNAATVPVFAVIAILSVPVILLLSKLLEKLFAKKGWLVL
ncbi:MAG: HAD-IC family P-type ATPase [Christensenellales bacterium]